MDAFRQPPISKLIWCMTIIVFPF
ncbi:hypothetical protein EFP34_09945 [Lacticaseibacillus paracasei]|nr:hypothetical protein [Lacticaseibacillus paracasei]NVO34014.1 hypothetical protein [Lacticaseibacillus paracasei subsp. paracasei]QPC20310.1 hypothetical protein LacP0734_07960 [Lacticaseibacillus paracasei subsp. tolerans]MCP9347250.1 hypothetical protein [Lacticaseibacillus paracasei]MCP9366867.1 hypothetical protein [Lacticaseibacillus paracasei]